MKNVTVIGGGLAGLLTSIQLIRAQIPVQLFEKRRFPFHRVCGEYISNETAPFLHFLKLFPIELGPATINQLQLTSVNGKSAKLTLDLGGFGISRYEFDYWLLKKAIEEGVEVHQDREIKSVTFDGDKFELASHASEYTSDVVIGAFGKRSKIDIAMGRSFIKKRSPYIGVKYHVKYNQPDGLISLHNFDNGYCGISNIENGKSNLCYLSHRNNLKNFGSIKAMEENVLFKNPFLENIFQNAEFLFDQPETINEISFETKAPVEDHVLMCGDAAGMITPLCGNGMAMAIHSSKILSELVINFCTKDTTRKKIEDAYTDLWSNQFKSRLWTGRQLQKLFGSPLASNLAVAIANNTEPLAQYLVSRTHGKTF